MKNLQDVITKVKEQYGAEVQLTNNGSEQVILDVINSQGLLETKLYISLVEIDQEGRWNFLRDISETDVLQAGANQLLIEDGVYHYHLEGDINRVYDIMAVTLR